MTIDDLNKQVFSKPKSEDPRDSAGGVVPTDLERAKKADLITLPKFIQGTNCGNCKHRDGGGMIFLCSRPAIQMQVSDRMCCSLWDARGVIRAWE